MISEFSNICWAGFCRKSVSGAKCLGFGLLHLSPITLAKQKIINSFKRWPYRFENLVTSLGIQDTIEWQITLVS